MKQRVMILSTLALALLTNQVFAEGDAAQGEDDFRKCAQCHRILSSEGEMIVKGGITGPNLWGVVGRVAAGDEAFRKYGDSLIALGETGFVWSEERITEYARDPKAFLRAHLDDDSARANMTFKLKDASDIAAYLATFGPSE